VGDGTLGCPACGALRSFYVVILNFLIDVTFYGSKKMALQQQSSLLDYLYITCRLCVVLLHLV
jgi:hypothetical protein